MAVIAVLAGAAATYAFQRWRAERERRNVLLTRYLAQLQDACESLWYRLRNLGYEGASVASERTYLVTTSMYTLARVLGIERMLSLEGLYSEIWKRFPQLREVVARRVVDDAVSTTMTRPGPELQQYDRVALAEAAVERHGDGFRLATFLEFRRRVEGPESEWWEPARKAVAALENNRDRVKPLMETSKALAVALSKVTDIDTKLEKERDPSEPEQTGRGF